MLPDAGHGAVDQRQAVTPPRYGNRLVLEGLKGRETVILEFPVPPWVDRYTVAGKKYTVTFKGSTVLDIMPREVDPNHHYPLYQRNSMKAPIASMHKVTRFAADRIIPLGAF